MRNIFGFGLIVGLLAGSAFYSCKTDEEELAPYFDKSKKLLLSETTVDGY